MMKRKLNGTWVAGLAVCALLGLTACGSKEAETAAASTAATTAAETTTAAAADTSAADAADTEESEDEWTAEGLFVDDEGQHLYLYHMTDGAGYDTDGWSVTVLELMWGGELEEKDGTLTGEFVKLDDDGNLSEGTAVVLTQEGDAVVLKAADGTESRFLPDDTDYSDATGSDDMLPFFQYNQIYGMHGFNPLEAACYDYLAFDKERDYDPDHTMIPYVEIVDVDETDPENVLIYGDYCLWEFEKQDDVLVAVSGGHCPGIIHAERFGEDDTAVYSADSMEEAYTDQDVEPLFGKYYEHYQRLSSDEEAREAKTAQIIADYVSANALDVTKYELSAGDIRELPESHAGQPHQKVDLPAFAWPDPDAKEAAIYSYLIDSNEMILMLGAEEYDVTIPYVVILGEEEEADGESKVLLSGWVNCYNLEDKTLEMMAGTEVSGAAHLRKTGDGYEVTAFEDVMDGNDYDKSAKQIFGAKYDEFIHLDDDTKEAVRKQVIREYVTENGLDITGYQDFGQDPVGL